MSEIREILFPSDLSSESDRAFEHARLLAERFRARLTLYHALETQGQYGEQGVREHLGRQASSLAVPHQIVVQGGLIGGHVLVDLALLDVIHKTRPDLTVMATAGRKGFASYFVGSVTQEVVQHAGRPVLCVRKAPHDPALPYCRLLVPTDFSEASRRAFPLAALLARSFGAKVSAVHVLASPTLATMTGAPGRAVAAPPTEEDVRRFLQAELAGIEVGVRVDAPGAPWRGIVKAAQEERSDLIVMSTQGLDSLHDRIIGSNTERVLRHAPCSVLVA